MATVSAKVYEHHKKNDGTYNVKICVHHKSERKFIDTSHYVVKKQLTKDFKIKDPFVVEKVDRQLREYRKVISELDDRLIYFTAESLRDFLRDKDEDIDFVKFCDNPISRLRCDVQQIQLFTQKANGMCLDGQRCAGIVVYNVLTGCH